MNTTAQHTTAILYLISSRIRRKAKSGPGPSYNDNNNNTNHTNNINNSNNNNNHYYSYYYYYLYY